MIQKTYENKKNIFGDNYNLQGYDYYAGGVFKYISKYTPVRTSSNLVESFDWRDRHGANINDGNNYYYGGSNGWITPFQGQGSCGSCAAFGVTAMIEAMTNLYFNNQFVFGNDNEELNLSELDVWCGCDGICWGQNAGIYPSEALNYIKDNGIVDEECYPYLPPCPGDEPKCTSPTKKITFDYWYHVSNSLGFDNIKSHLIQYGPLAQWLRHGTSNYYDHEVLLVGYRYEPETNATTWIYKDSNFGYFVELDISSPEEMYRTHYILQGPDWGIHQLVGDDYERNCKDFDNDGYSNWGVGYRMDGCGGELLQDSDDYNPRIGPFDGNYFGTPVAPDMVVSYNNGLGNNQIIEENDFITFTSTGNKEFTITIKNEGNAQLNFYNENFDPPANLIESSNPDVFEIIGSLDPYIPINGDDNTFQIYYNYEEGLGVGQDQAIITIHTLEPEYEDFEFVIANFDCTVYTGPAINITGIESWNDCGIITGDVYVQDDAELTIEGKYGFIEGVNIFVEQGGRLIIDGGTLSNACGNTWQGIDVWGNSGLSQYVSSNQGFVRLTNDGIISNAETAIEASKMENGQYISSTTGGIVLCTNFEFIDNTRDVVIYPFENTHPITKEKELNICFFNNIEFINTSCNPNPKVSLWGVDGVSFKGCSFVNEFYPVMGGCDKGIGISSFSSGFYVDYYCLDQIIPCNTIKQSYFENLNYGIYAYNGELSKYISIDTAIFKNNNTGIYMSWVDNQSVIRNKFIYDETHDLTDEVAGLYLEYGTGYSIEENDFNSDVQDITIMGIQLFNTGPLYNVIYNNTFNNLNTGVSAAGINRNEEGNGLCIKCNDFDDCITDIFVSSGNLSGQTIGIAEKQGDYGIDPPPGVDPNSMGAGNTFTDTETNPNYKIDEDCALIYYTYQKDDENTPEKIKPNPVTDNVRRQEDQQTNYSKEISCPSNLNGSLIDELVEKSILISEFAEITAYSDTLDMLTDGGDTDALNSDIQFSFPNEALELRQQLIDESPYLCDTAMKAAIDKENVLPNAMIRDILVANPQSAKTPDVIQTIDDRFDPMPGYMMAEIMGGQVIVGAKEILEQRLSFHKSKRDISLTKLERNYLSDTLNASAANDSLISLWSQEPYPKSKYNLCFQHLFSGDSLGIFNTLDSIPLEFDLDVQEENIHQDYEILFNVLEQLHCDSILLDSNMIQSLLSISDKITAPGIYARNILINDSIISYEEDLYFPDLLKASQEWDYMIPKNSKEILMKVFPNPAGNYFIIEYNLSESQGNLLLVVSDINGNRLKSYILKDEHNQLVISSENLKSGTYIVQLFLNNRLKEATKIVIIK